MNMTLPKFMRGNKTGRSHDNLSYSALNHWRLILVIQFLLLFTAGLFSSFTFSQIKKLIENTSEGASGDITEKNLNKDMLENIVETFQNKEKMTVMILERKPNIVDPATGPLTRKEESESQIKKGELLQALETPLPS